jgi:hypothetical protein
LCHHWNKLSSNSSSSTILKDLISAGQEAIDRKMEKWNKKVVYTAAYLDPAMRVQINMLRESSNIPMNEVYSWLI